MSEDLILFFRSVVTYFVLVFFTRVMGRKQISQLTYFDYVVGITIGSIAAMTATDRNVKMFNGIVSLIVWSVLTILISQIKTIDR